MPDSGDPLPHFKYSPTISRALRFNDTSCRNFNCPKTGSQKPYLNREMINRKQRQGMGTNSLMMNRRFTLADNIAMVPFTTVN